MEGNVEEEPNLSTEITHPPPIPNPQPNPNPGPTPQINPQPSESSTSRKKGKTNKKAWNEICASKSILCERQIIKLPIPIPMQYQQLRADLNMVYVSLYNMGLVMWFEEVRGYIASFVKEFYVTAEKEENGEKIKAKVKDKSVVVTPDSIADYLGCSRPTPEQITYPREGYSSPTGVELAQKVCKDVDMYRAKGFFTQGMLKGCYALLNKIIHYNLFPKGAQKTPKEDVVRLAYELGRGVHIDVALLIWQCIIDFPTYSGSNASLPFACMISTFCIEAVVKPSQKNVWVPPPLEPINYVTLKRSEGQHASRVRPVPPPVPSLALPTVIPPVDVPSTSVVPPSGPSATLASDIDVLEMFSRIERGMIEDRAYMDEERAMRASWEADLISRLDTEVIRRVAWERHVDDILHGLTKDDIAGQGGEESESEYTASEDPWDD